MLLLLNDKEAAVVLAGLISGAGDPARKNGLLTLLARKIGGDRKNARGDAKVIAAIQSASRADPSQRLAWDRASQRHQSLDARLRARP